MYGIFTYISPKNGPNVGKYSIHGAYGIEIVDLPMKHGDFPSFFVCLPVPRMAYRQGVQEGRLAIESHPS